MAKGYNIPAADALSMLGDAHSTNWAENYQFFVNQNNPTNFERVWNQAYYLYRRIGAITHQPVPFDQVMDFSVIEKLGKEEKYSLAEGRVHVAVRAQAQSARSAGRAGDPDQHGHRSTSIPTAGTCTRRSPRKWTARRSRSCYDPNVDLVLEEIAKLAGQFGAARIIIEGHTDSSMKGTGAGRRWSRSCR